MFGHHGPDRRQVEGLQSEARAFEAHKQYAEAAGSYTRLAAAYQEENVLICAGYHHDALRLWLKAGLPGQAVQSAETAFRLLDDAGWLEKSMEQVLDLKKVIDELNAAGYAAEAGAFAQKLDARLAAFGLMLRPAAQAPLPQVCPSCGAALPASFQATEVTCAFCGWVVRAAA